MAQSNFFSILIILIYGSLYLSRFLYICTTNRYPIKINILCELCSTEYKNGWTPLHFAAWRGLLEVANFLIEKGADINAENIFGRIPIHIAAENNNKDIIDFFLSKGMSIDDGFSKVPRR